MPPVLDDELTLAAVAVTPLHYHDLLGIMTLGNGKPIPFCFCARVDSS
ncbi:MAG: hypothetical protein KAG53_08145 [Endozoicomonadaceae bacterium]|nr:hypothetical protein [Endozoicomonadaceae bacterium]